MELPGRLSERNAFKRERVRMSFYPLSVTNSIGHSPVNTFLRTLELASPEFAPKASEVCYGSVSHQELPLVCCSDTDYHSFVM